MFVESGFTNSTHVIHRTIILRYKFFCLHCSNRIRFLIMAKLKLLCMNRCYSEYKIMYMQ